jgi:hypothetical protein
MHTRQRHHLPHLFPLHTLHSHCRRSWIRGRRRPWACRSQRPCSPRCGSSTPPAWPSTPPSRPWRRRRPSRPPARRSLAGGRRAMGCGARVGMGCGSAVCAASVWMPSFWLHGKEMQCSIVFQLKNHCSCCAAPAPQGHLAAGGQHRQRRPLPGAAPPAAQPCLLPRRGATARPALPSALLSLIPLDVPCPVAAC